MFQLLNFSNFIQAQMSVPEMFLRYYNCLKFSKFKNLAIKFDLLENLTIENLISNTHILEGINLKSKKNY